MDWQTIRNTFMRDIGGDPPGAALEDELITAYAQHPDAVTRSIEKITLAFKAGKIRSPWGALKAEVAKATEAARNPTHDKGSNRGKVIQRAEQWIRTAGIHYDRETEVADELYGERGILLAYPDTRQRILEQWRELRPLGEAVEAEAEAAAAKRRAQPKIETTGATVHTIDELRAIARAKAADTSNLI